MWKRREEKKERKKKWGVHMRERERERVVIMLGLIKWVSYFSKYLQKCHWVMLFKNWKLIRGVFWI